MENRFTVSSSPHIRSSETTQNIMRDVTIALTPAALYGVYNFGLRALIVLVISVVSAMIAEAACQKIRKQKIAFHKTIFLILKNFNA